MTNTPNSTCNPSAIYSLATRIAKAAHHLANVRDQSESPEETSAGITYILDMINEVVDPILFPIPSDPKKAGLETYHNGPLVSAIQWFSKDHPMRSDRLDLLEKDLGVSYDTFGNASVFLDAVGIVDLRNGQWIVLEDDKSPRIMAHSDFYDSYNRIAL